MHSWPDLRIASVSPCAWLATQRSMALNSNCEPWRKSSGEWRSHPRQRSPARSPAIMTGTIKTPWKPVPGRLAPRTGFEPVTYRLTAGRSTVELSRNICILSDLHQRTCHIIHEDVLVCNTLFGKLLE